MILCPWYFVKVHHRAGVGRAIPGEAVPPRRHKCRGYALHVTPMDDGVTCPPDRMPQGLPLHVPVFQTATLEEELSYEQSCEPDRK